MINGKAAAMSGTVQSVVHKAAASHLKQGNGASQTPPLVSLARDSSIASAPAVIQDVNRRRQPAHGAATALLQW